MINYMTPQNRRWDEFANLLATRCKMVGEGEEMTWHCAGGEKKLGARAVLRKMGYKQAYITRSLTFFESEGGRCDCEILFNVDR
jgi:hypothetical protein